MIGCFLRCRSRIGRTGFCPNAGTRLQNYVNRNHWRVQLRDAHPGHCGSPNNASRSTEVIYVSSASHSLSQNFNRRLTPHLFPSAEIALNVGRHGSHNNSCLFNCLVYGYNYNHVFLSFIWSSHRRRHAQKMSSAVYCYCYKLHNETRVKVSKISAMVFLHYNVDTCCNLIIACLHGRQSQRKIIS